MTKPDAMCANCGERIFWATAGWWIHLYFSVKCFRPAVVSMRKRVKNALPVLPRRVVVPEVLSLFSPGVVVSRENAAVYMQSRSTVVFRSRMAYRGTHAVRFPRQSVRQS